MNINATTAHMERLSKADAESAFRASRLSLRQNQNAAFGHDPGVSFTEGERIAAEQTTAN